VEGYSTQLKRRIAPEDYPRKNRCWEQLQQALYAAGASVVPQPQAVPPPMGAAANGTGDNGSSAASAGAAEECDRRRVQPRAKLIPASIWS